MSTTPAESRSSATRTRRLRERRRQGTRCRDAMQDEKRVALARIVVAHRGHMIMLEPLGKGLLGTTLRFDYEVRSEKDYFAHVPSPRTSKDMVSLATDI
jgi:DNA end-binding protein Ku